MTSYAVYITTANEETKNKIKTIMKQYMILINHT